MPRLPGHSKNWGGERPGSGPKTSQHTKTVSISLPKELLDRLDRVVYETGEGRSAFIARVVEKALRKK